MISGLPTIAGTFPVNLSVSNASGAAAGALSIAVAPIPPPPPPSITYQNHWFGVNQNGTTVTVSARPTTGSRLVVTITGAGGSISNHSATDNRGSAYLGPAGGIAINGIALRY